MSKLAKEISTTGIATFVVLFILFGVAQVIGWAFQAVPTPTALVAEAAEVVVETVENVADEVADASADTSSDTTETAIAAAQDPAPAPAAQAVTQSDDGAPEARSYSLGRPATVAEVAAWDIDVRPDGAGLPEGSGDVFTGEEVFAEKCAVCHGDFGEAVGRWPVLAGGQDTLTDERPVKTIGSYWPYLSTVWDYVHRAMPFGDAQSLSDDEVYAITAYLLYVNDLVDDEFELSHENFSDIALPNQPNFYPDDRAETEYAKFVSSDVCMKNCKETVEITGRAAVVDVTPEETKARQLREAVNRVRDGTAAPKPAVKDTAQASSTETATTEATAPLVQAADGPDPALVADGEKVFKKCKACHQVGADAKNKTGPALNGIIGATMGSVEGFRYSNVFKAAADEGRTWTAEEMAAFLAAPRKHMKGTKMSFNGLKKQKDIDAILAYLQSFEK